MKITAEKQYDIFVAGGGVAGVAAALQAARMGKKVLIAEKCVQLGGMATTGLVNLIVPMCNGRGKQIVKGMADEFLQLCIRYGYDDMPAEWKNGEPGQGNTTRRLVTHFSAPIFALVLRELMDDHGVDVLFDTVVTDVEAENGHIRAAILFNKSGYTRVKAKIFIDTTGDSDLLWYAGVPTVKQGSYHTYAGVTLTLDTCQKALEARDVAKLYFDTPGGNASATGKNHPEGMPLWDGTDGDSISEYYRVNQLELLQKLKTQNRRERDIVILPAMHQLRTTRRIDGDYTLTEADVYRHHATSVGAICDAGRQDHLYEVPYGTLIRTGWDNILTAGRSASAQGWAWDVLRVIPPAILTGQAAGAAAAQAMDAGCPVAELPIEPLQEAMAATGVDIHFDDALVPADHRAIETVDVGER